MPLPASCLGAVACLLFMAVPGLHAAPPTSSDTQIEFFESRIRPVLVEHCYSCHNTSGTAEGELALDHRKAMHQGGANGDILSLGRPQSSRLIAVLKHEIDGLEMPEGGPRLDDQVIADFEKWISQGAPDPRDTPPSAEELTEATSWKAQRERRMKWWSFQPIDSHQPPIGKKHPIDRFISARLAEQSLDLAPRADTATLIRRLFINLIGLPPTTLELKIWSDKYANSDDDAVTESLIDHLIASDHFGERWARHWMDWIRYAESHGSEGDPTIANAWIYRDYLIRAINSDVPYDQLVREHIAGDLLKSPRCNESLGINESIIGASHWRMVFHGFAPTDALDEKVRFTDDQINVFSKAFLGLTVSCARCHDHKFDAISQKDYYALFAVLASCRPGRNVIDLPEVQQKNVKHLSELKPRIRDAIASDWLESLPSLRARLIEQTRDRAESNAKHSVLTPLAMLKSLAAASDIRKAWTDAANRYRDSLNDSTAKASQDWDLSNPDSYGEWYQHGIGLKSSPSPAGEFAILSQGETVLRGIYPAGVYSHTLSSKHPARLTSPDIEVAENQELWIHSLGDSGAMSRYVVQDYPRSGTVYPVHELKPTWEWRRFDLSYWKGDSVHVEMVTGKDAPLLVKNNDRSWFGVRSVRVVEKGAPPPKQPLSFIGALIEEASSEPASIEEVVELYVKAMEEAIQAWKSGAITDAQADLLDHSLRALWLTNTLNSLNNARPLVVQYRQWEEAIRVPTRVPGLDETHGRIQPLYVRGDHKQPSEIVPRRFLEAIDPTPYKTGQSGRRELADDLLRDDNPLTRRVIVNRLWHHLFGQGIVETPDNFGKLGSKPAHPELLDWLANQFAEEGWSLKKLIRLIVTSRTWQQSATPTRLALEVDPGNRLLSHANVRRLEAEVIRDSLLVSSGQLDRTVFGEPVAGNSLRRSVYVEVHRNRLYPLLRVFDFPEPSSTIGRRDVTNVPAQSLTMMNDPQVAELGGKLASNLLAKRELISDQQRIAYLFTSLFSRPATSEETELSLAYLDTSRDVFQDQRKEAEAAHADLRDTRAQVESVLAPTRKRLREEVPKSQSEIGLVRPIGRWNFNGDLRDSTGSYDGVAHGNATVTSEYLDLRSGGYVTTPPLDRLLKEKTLEVWVTMDDIDQRGGGVITVQTADGSVFDSIVFAEKTPRKWLAGSDHFRRTQSFTSSSDNEPKGQVVHIAIVYHTDGRIVGYRNGERYGREYKSDGPNLFHKGESIISFGVRHLPAGGNRLWRGKIDLAQLYDRALTDDDVAASFHDSDSFVSRSRVLAALSTEQRESVETLQGKIAESESRLASMKRIPAGGNELEAWTDLTRALLTLKEFLYVR